VGRGFLNIYPSSVEKSTEDSFRMGTGHPRTLRWLTWCPVIPNCCYDLGDMLDIHTYLAARKKVVVRERAQRECQSNLITGAVCLVVASMCFLRGGDWTGLGYVASCLAVLGLVLGVRGRRKSKIENASYEQTASRVLPGSATSLLETAHLSRLASNEDRTLVSTSPPRVVSVTLRGKLFLRYFFSY
jgi:hypothetical protein